MNSGLATPIPTAAAGNQAASRRHIRGSSLLVAGQVLAKAVNFAVHVLIVRYLAQADYGAFAYALALVKLGESVADFGLHRAISRFVPIYHEQQDYAKACGTIWMAAGTLVSLGLATVLLVYCLQGLIANTLINDSQAVQLLLILIFLAPVEGLDRMLVGLFAVFASPRSIFFRRYVLAPGLKLSVVLMLIGGQCSVVFLAGGYLAASVLGLAIGIAMLVRMLRQQRLLEHFRPRAVQVPWREVLLFTTPLLTTDLVHVLMSVLDAVLLGYFAGAAEVATFRAVRPAAMLNQLVFATFAVLYTPQAARLFGRGDHQGIDHLYWQSAAWIAVMTFPIFVLTFSLAQPLTVLLYGSRYEQSGTVLAVLALGYYFHAALGFNGTTLTIFRKVGYVAALNLVVAAVNIVAYLLLIPRYGALGAAIGTCIALAVHNLLKQAGLVMGTGVRLFPGPYLRIYLMIVLGAAALLAGQTLGNFPLPLSLALAAVVFWVLVRSNRDLLDLEHTFPELMRLPGVRWLLGKEHSPPDSARPQQE